MVSSALLERFGSKYESLQNRLKGIQATAEKTMGTVLQTVEVVGAVALGAYANGRYGKPDTTGGTGLNEWDLHSVPVDAAVGVVFHGLGFAGMLGKYDEHAHNLGDGFLGSYAYRLGNKQGLKAAATATAATATPIGATAAAGAMGQGYNPYAQGRQAQGAWRGVG